MTKCAEVRIRAEFHKVYALKQTHHPDFGSAHSEDAAVTMQESWEPIINDVLKRRNNDEYTDISRGIVFIINSGLHDSCLDNTMSDFQSSLERLASHLLDHIREEDQVVWRTTAAVHRGRVQPGVLAKTEYKNTMNSARAKAFSAMGAWVMGRHGMGILDVYPMTAVGEELLLDGDIRHYSNEMYSLW
eukprot:CAMPEP_0185747626 /NCGR_PEP_ID=MMETSP1174-20130828/6261_1 /TAXON_ID=35687 /ORGANISM="Dictyocha speculum, Strain CCMP1381" /LENGTH=187 /DNA_ID=CAMNT_0028422891 /DNA_START=55 /DNA_END=615 /DNA_ORIENTATION=-